MGKSIWKKEMGVGKADFMVLGGQPSLASQWDSISLPTQTPLLHFLIDPLSLRLCMWGLLGRRCACREQTAIHHEEVKLIIMPGKEQVAQYRYVEILKKMSITIATPPTTNMSIVLTTPRLSSKHFTEKLRWCIRHGTGDLRGTCTSKKKNSSNTAF